MKKLLFILVTFLLFSCTKEIDTNCNCPMNTIMWVKNVKEMGQIQVSHPIDLGTKDTLVECSTNLILTDTIRIDYSPNSYKEIYTQKYISCN